MKKSLCKSICIRIAEELLPFVLFYGRKRRLINKVEIGNNLLDDKSFDIYNKLNIEDLNNRIEQEHERSKNMDEKTFKMTLAISFGLTILGSTASLLTNNISNQLFKLIAASFTYLSIFYSLAAGFTAIASLKTLPTYGYGTYFMAEIKKDKPKAIDALVSQEYMNIIRHLRNESSYQSLRNSFILLFGALFIFVISVILSCINVIIIPGILI